VRLTFQRFRKGTFSSAPTVLSTLSQVYVGALGKVPFIL
jgi:hypothetical protein